jgi:ubiquinone/menaquinone biosynthesis C-methylase UbiE
MAPVGVFFNAEKILETLGINEKTGDVGGMKSIFDKYWKRYDEWYDKYNSAFLSEIDAVKKVLPKRGKGLEIGVGTGRFASILGIAYGIDPSENMIKTARQRGIDARLGFGEEIPFTNNTFDYAVIINTLCFVKDPLKVLQETARVLKRNGEIAVGIIDKNNFLGRFYQKKKSPFYMRANFLETTELMQLLKMAGFNQFVYYQTLFSLPKDISRVEKPRKGFDCGGFIVIGAKKLKK